MKQRVVIKLGGSSLQNPATLFELATLIRAYRQMESEVVLVHGGGPAINQELVRRGIQWTFIDGQRQTTPQMIAVIEKVLAKEINPMLVSLLCGAGIPSVGLSGAGDKILHCALAQAELMRVGQVERVNVAAIESALALEEAPVPVIAPIGLGPKNKKLNVNADWAATKIAIALNADKLVFLTDQSGILDQNQKVVRTVTPRRIHKMIAAGVISGGMRTKVLAMLAALESGVGQVRVLHASSAGRLLEQHKIGSVLTYDQATARKDVMHGHAS